MFQPQLLLTSLTSTSTLIVHSALAPPTFLLFLGHGQACSLQSLYMCPFLRRELSFPCHHMACFIISILSSFLKCYLFIKASFQITLFLKSIPLPSSTHMFLLHLLTSDLLCFIYFLSPLKGIFVFYFFSMLCSFGDLSSPTRDRTGSLAVEAQSHNH